jgi:D-alanine-D-alanine ligase
MRPGVSGPLMKHLRIALIYNAYTDGAPESPGDQGGSHYLALQMRRFARTMHGLGHTVRVLPVTQDFTAFQHRLLEMRPDVVFNQYDDVVHGALYEMRIAALVRILGFPLTGSPALGLALTRYKHMSASLLAGLGIAIPPCTALLEKIGDVDRHSWLFPLIVQPSQEHAGIGLERDSIVTTRKALREKVRHILATYKQPALVQRFLPGREFNVGIVGGRKPRVLPLAEVDYSRLPPGIPPMMSYAAKWEEQTVEYQNTSIVCPAKIEPELARQIEDAALRAFRAVGAWGYGRVDMRLDEEGVPCVLEVNCNPLLDRGVGIARSAERAGISFPELLQLIIRAAFDGPPFDLSIPLPVATPRAIRVRGEGRLRAGVRRRRAGSVGEPPYVGKVHGQRDGHGDGVHEPPGGIALPVVKPERGAAPFQLGKQGLAFRDLEP